MSPLASPKKRPWLNRQLSKISDKLHKNNPEGKKNNAGVDSAGVPTGHAPVSVGREVGFSAFGDGKENQVGAGCGKENDARVEVAEVGAPHPGTPVKHDKEGDVDEWARGLWAAGHSKTNGSAGGSNLGSGCDGSQGRTHGYVPYDGGDSGKEVGHGGIQGEVGPNTALNSHPIASLFRALD